MRKRGGADSSSSLTRTRTSFRRVARKLPTNESSSSSTSVDISGSTRGQDDEVVRPSSADMAMRVLYRLRLKRCRHLRPRKADAVASF